MNGRRRLLLLLPLVVLLTAFAGCGDDPDADVPVPPRWDEETLDIAASIPVMDGGRVKPLDTFARFTLLPIAGKRSLEPKRGYKLSALEWLLDVVLRPKYANRYRAFVVPDDAILEPLGLHVEGRKKRDRYSFEELDTIQQALVDAYNELRLKEAKDRDRLEEQTFQLAVGYIRYRDVQNLSFRILAPSATKDAQPAWYLPTEVANWGASDPAAAADVQLLARAVSSGVHDDVESVKWALRDLRAHVRARAAARGEGNEVDLEVSYYRADYLTNALVLFILAFIVVAVSWMIRTGRKYWFTSLGIVAIPTLILVTAIVIRCMIRGRPPVSSLYETLLFITAVACIAAIVTEVLTRRRFALSLAPLIGIAGLFFAGMYEAHEARDTMPQLVAVLDTNFWLATHVTTVTIGYSAGLLASLLASIYVVGKLVARKRMQKRTFADLSRMVYGVICFGLLFSTVGTILGGVWANDSWGRFWGWDPKENGALMIVLAELAMLHGRMGGYLRQFGFCLAAVFNGAIVGFSWWHVNYLGVGLHSYGFARGIVVATWSFYAVQALILGLGTVAWFLERKEKAAASRGKDRSDLPDPGVVTG